MEPTDPLALRRLHTSFLDWVEPQRPALWALCRRLCSSPCDAEDLIQEVLLACFALLGRRGELPRHPRAYLLRCACNIYLGAQGRQRGTTVALDPDTLPAPAAPIPPSELAEAWAVAQARLSPREQLCVLLKDVCGCSLQEIAGWLESSEVAIKDTLHRGRGKLRDHRSAPQPPRQAVDPGLLERFVTAFNARDLSALAALLHPEIRVQVVGCVEELGADEALTGSIPHTFDDGHARVITVLGEQILILAPPQDSHGELVTAARLSDNGSHITRLQWYFFCPELLAELAGALGMARWTAIRHY